MFKNEIKIDANEMMYQATGTAGLYMEAAKRQIDQVFGDDYAKNHPELVAKFMEVANADFCNAMTLQTVQGAVRALIDQLDDREINLMISI